MKSQSTVHKSCFFSIQSLSLCIFLAFDHHSTSRRICRLGCLVPDMTGMVIKVGPRLRDSAFQLPLPAMMSSRNLVPTFFTIHVVSQSSTLTWFVPTVQPQNKHRRLATFHHLLVTVCDMATLKMSVLILTIILGLDRRLWISVLS